MSKIKKIIIAFAVLLCVVAVAIPTGLKIQNNKIEKENTEEYGKYKKSNDYDISVIAHRGYSDAAPENTLAAFSLAGENSSYATNYELGVFDAVECDVQLTKDNVWVIMHDDTVDRMTNGKGKVADLTFDEIRNLTIDSGNYVKDYPNEKVPTLDEFLDVCGKYGLRPYIEIKMDADKEQVQSLYDIILKHEHENWCTVISFNYDSLKYLREIDDSISIYALVSKINDNTTQMCVDYNFGIDFNANEKSNTIKKINGLTEKGVFLAAWTINTQTQYNRMIDNGVIRITANCPSSVLPNQEK